MSVRSRLRQLEREARGRTCAWCVLPPTGPGYVVYEPPEPRPEQEWCEACGRPLYFFIQVVEEAEHGRTA